MVSGAVLGAKGLTNRGNRVDVDADNGVAVDGVICLWMTLIMKGGGLWRPEGDSW